MPNWKKVIVSGSNASLNSLTVSNGITGSLFGTASYAISASQAINANTSSYVLNAVSASYAATSSYASQFNVVTALTASGLRYPTADGLENQVLKTDGTNDLAFGDVNTLFETIYTGENITKSDPLYISGSNGANPIVYKADAANAAKMPVTYIASETIGAGNTTRGIVLGLIEGIDLTGYAEGTEVYVAAGGGWTSTRPTGSAIVQVLGIVTKGGSGGKGLVLNPGPVELPNLQAGYAWVGDTTGVPQAVSTSSLLVSTSSYSIQSTSASFATTASFAISASQALNSTNANTASYINQLNQNVSISGSANISQSINTPLINVTSGSLNEGIIDINNSINSWIYSGKSFSIGGQETSPVGVFFKSDGTKMYVNGSSGDDINEYNLGTPWDVTTAVFSTLFSTAGQDTAAGDLFFSSDGTRLYITGDANNTIFQYSLGTAWDISTATYSSISFSVAAKDTNPSGIWFKSDGTKMYVCGFSSDSIHEYDLGTAWNVSTATFLQSFSVSSQDTTPASINFNNDGTKFYIVGSTNDNIYEYNLGTPWNISTAVYFSRTYVGNQEATPTGLYITTDNVYVVGSTNDTVFQYYSNTNALRLTSDSLILNTELISTTGSVSIDQNLDVLGKTNLVGATTAGSVTTSTLTVNGTLSSTSTTTLASSTAAQTVALGAGATLAATTKTINIGTSGVATSITNVNIGSAVAGALGTIILNHNTLVTGSLNVSQGITGSLFGTSSFATQSTSASYAATASYADNFIVKNTLTAQTLVVSTVSSSVVYSSGSNIFGNSLSNTQTFTGSVLITGSQNITGSLTVGFGSNKELEVLPTGITAGNLITDIHRFTGSLLVTGSNNTIKGDNTTIQSGPGTYIEVTDGRIFLSDKTVITQSLAVGNVTASVVSGRIDASNDVVAFSTSDKHLKENIQPIENALDKLDNIGGYTFDWNNQIEIHGYEGHDIGVIAQEIESILPEVVTTRDNGYKAVKYEKIVPFLIQCIKELKDEIRDLKSQK